jgi:hypothetical protein
VFAALIRLPRALRCHRIISRNTILRWDRRLDREKWTYPNRPGRPPIDDVLCTGRRDGDGEPELGIQENQGELLKLATASAPRRSAGSSTARRRVADRSELAAAPWRRLAGVLAVDFFHVDSAGDAAATLRPVRTRGW